MNPSMYLFSSLSRLELLAIAESTVATAAAVILGSSYSMSWFSLALSIGGLFLGVFLVAMFTISLQITMKRREVAILRALGATRSSLLRAFLLRIVLIAVMGCLAGTMIGYCVAFFNAECSLLSLEIVGLSSIISLLSSFCGGASAVKRVLDLKVGEVLRQ